MTCRRCNTHRNVAHHRNGLFNGWFCAACVDLLVDELIADLSEAPLIEGKRKP